jgi:hypothetical protein
MPHEKHAIIIVPPKSADTPPTAPTAMLTFAPVDNPPDDPDAFAVEDPVAEAPEPVALAIISDCLNGVQ